jgi:hypothetical protein
MNVKAARVALEQAKKRDAKTREMLADAQAVLYAANEKLARVDPENERELQAAIATHDAAQLRVNALIAASRNIADELEKARAASAREESASALQAHAAAEKALIEKGKEIAAFVDDVREQIHEKWADLQEVRQRADAAYGAVPVEAREGLTSPAWATRWATLPGPSYAHDVLATAANWTAHQAYVEGRWNQCAHAKAQNEEIGQEFATAAREAAESAEIKKEIEDAAMAARSARWAKEKGKQPPGPRVDDEAGEP